MPGGLGYPRCISIANRRRCVVSLHITDNDLRGARVRRRPHGQDRTWHARRRGQLAEPAHGGGRRRRPAGDGPLSSSTTRAAWACYGADAQIGPLSLAQCTWAGADPGLAEFRSRVPWPAPKQLVARANTRRRSATEARSQAPLYSSECARSVCAMVHTGHLRSIRERASCSCSVASKSHASGIGRPTTPTSSLLYGRKNSWSSSRTSWVK
jgi:hypothetical protein